LGSGQLSGRTDGCGTAQGAFVLGQRRACASEAARVCVIAWVAVVVFAGLASLIVQACVFQLSLPASLPCAHHPFPPRMPPCPLLPAGAGDNVWAGWVPAAAGEGETTAAEMRQKLRAKQQAQEGAGDEEQKQQGKQEEEESVTREKTIGQGERGGLRSCPGGCRSRGRMHDTCVAHVAAWAEGAVGVWAGWAGTAEWQGGGKGALCRPGCPACLPRFLAGLAGLVHA